MREYVQEIKFKCELSFELTDIGSQLLLRVFMSTLSHFCVRKLRNQN